MCIFHCRRTCLTRKYRRSISLWTWHHAKGPSLTYYGDRLFTVVPLNVTYSTAHCIVSHGKFREALWDYSAMASRRKQTCSARMTMPTSILDIQNCRQQWKDNVRMPIDDIHGRRYWRRLIYVPERLEKSGDIDGRLMVHNHWLKCRGTRGTFTAETTTLCSTSTPCGPQTLLSGQIQTLFARHLLSCLPEHQLSATACNIAHYRLEQRS